MTFEAFKILYVDSFVGDFTREYSVYEKYNIDRNKNFSYPKDFTGISEISAILDGGNMNGFHIAVIWMKQTITGHSHIPFSEYIHLANLISNNSIASVGIYTLKHLMYSFTIPDSGYVALSFFTSKASFILDCIEHNNIALNKGNLKFMNNYILMTTQEYSNYIMVLNDVSLIPKGLQGNKVSDIIGEAHAAFIDNTMDRKFYYFNGGNMVLLEDIDQINKFKSDIVLMGSDTNHLRASELNFINENGKYNVKEFIKYNSKFINKINMK